MSLGRRCRQVARRMVFGDVLLPQAFTIGLTSPQTEISVWLNGLEAPVDVTDCHSMACADPFTVCIAFDKGCDRSDIERCRLSLEFCEKRDQNRVLGKIALHSTSRMALADGRQLVLFGACGSANYCMSNARTYAYYLFYRYLLWRKADVAGIKMSSLERRAVMVMFIRPHPVVLVSIGDKASGNIFPMNIMGDLGGGYFAFALKNSRLAARLVECARSVALSDVPLSKTSLAYRLGANHRRSSINWDEIPFAMKISTEFHIPVPVFSHRVREMDIEINRDLGSHTLFIARLRHEERSGDDVGLHIIHGFYQAWRLRERREELVAAVAEDLFNKKGTPYGSLPL